MRLIKIKRREKFRCTRRGGEAPSADGVGLPCGEPPFCFLSAENKTFAPAAMGAPRTPRKKENSKISA